MAKTRSRSHFADIVAIGGRVSFYADLYHFVIRLSWVQYSLLVTAVFLVTNVVFALLFMASPGDVANAKTFLDHFYFSVETLATIGYGTMSPLTAWAHVVVTLEALAGVAFTAVVTGVTFVRFARPTAQVLFSNHLVMAPRDGVPHLCFRVANLRGNQIIEAQLSMLVLTTVRTKEGDVMRRPQPVKLVRDRNPLFALSWVVLHVIDESSPFYGDGIEKLRAEKADMLITLTGLDETLMQTIIARWRYVIGDIVPNARFVDVLHVRDDGTRVIDYRKFQDIEPL